MTYPNVDYPDLWTWWRRQHEQRHSGQPSCEVCFAVEVLVLVDRGTNLEADRLAFNDLAALCARCTDRLAQLVGDRRAPGERWYGMPRGLAVPTVLRELSTGQVALNEPESDPEGEL